MIESRRRALKVATAYAAVSALWIYGSDLVVARALPAPVIPGAQSLKGLGFVAVTTLIAYVLVERLWRRVDREVKHVRTAETMLQQVLETVPTGVVLTADDGTVTSLNPFAEKMLGATTAESAGRDLDEVLGVSEANAPLGVPEILRSGSATSVSLAGSASRLARTVSVRAARLDPETPASGWVVALADVTQAQDARDSAERLVGGYRFLSLALESSVRASDEAVLFSRIADAAVESGRFCGVWAVAKDAETGEYRDVSLAGLGPRAREVAEMMRDMTAHNPDGVPFSAGQALVSNHVASDPTSVWHGAAKAEGFGSSATLGFGVDGELIGALTLFAKNPGGFDAAEIGILRELAGFVDYAVGLLRLDQRRRKAEEELQHSEKGYRELFECNPGAMWIYERQTHRILAVNAAAIAKYGYGRERFLAMTIDDIRPPQEVPRLREVTHSLREGFDDSGIWTHRDSSGREFPVHVYAHPLSWEGTDAVLVMVIEVARIGE